jgi:hypothetical protein
VLVAGILVGWAVPREAPGPDWLRADGGHWREMPPSARLAYAEGFVTGGALAQALATGVAAEDSGGLRRALDSLAAGGGLGFPYAANVYAARVDDYYWWEDRRSRPIWHAFQEVNHDLTRMKQ